MQKQWHGVCWPSTLNDQHHWPDILSRKRTELLKIELVLAASEVNWEKLNRSHLVDTFSHSASQHHWVLVTLAWMASVGSEFQPQAILVTRSMHTAIYTGYNDSTVTQFKSWSTCPVVFHWKFHNLLTFFHGQTDMRSFKMECLWVLDCRLNKTSYGRTSPCETVTRHN